MKKKAKTSKVKLFPIELQKTSTFSAESLHKGINDESGNVLYLSGDQLNSMFKSEKKQKKFLLKNRNTRDISHIKDKLKPSRPPPLILPTNLTHLKALAESPSITGLLTHHKSCPMICIHKDCVERAISSPLKEETTTSISHLSETARLEREFLGSPSGLQDIESLYQWFFLMKKNCKSDEDMEVVYSICTKELIRQVTVHCSLRGKLLKEILGKQPNVFSKKLIKAQKEFMVFKKEQDDFLQRVLNENREEIKGMRCKILEVENKLARSEEIRSGIEESLLKYRLDYSLIQRKCYEGEFLWRQKAEKYLKELNRVKSSVFVGTDKLAKFFAREDLKFLEIDQDLLEFVKVCEKVSEIDFFSEGFDDYHTETEAWFKKSVEKSNDFSPESFKAVENTHHIIEEKRESQENNFKAQKDEQKSVIIVNKELPTEKEETNSKEHSNPEDESKSNDPDPKESETSKEKSSDNPFYRSKTRKDSSKKKYLAKYKSEALNLSDEYIKTSEERSELNQSSEHHYIFTEEEETSVFELVSVPNPAQIEYEINEEASHLEESRLSSIGPDKEENPFERISMNDSIQVVSMCTQTDDLLFPDYSQQFVKIGEILSKASTANSKSAIKAITEIVRRYKEGLDGDDNEFEKLQKSFAHADHSGDDEAPTHGMSKSQAEVDNVKTELLEIVNNAGELAAKCELKKEEIAELDEQLDIKSAVLRRISKPSLTKKSSIKSKKEQISSNNPEKAPIIKKLTLQLDPEKISWNEGYETGFEEGKVQSYIWLVDQVKSSPKYKEILESPSLFKQNSEALTPKRKLTRINTKFSEFNFHIPIRNSERKKTHPSTNILERFLSQPLNKIKVKSTFSKKNVNKILVSIYTEAYGRLSADLPVSLIEATHDEFLTKYATKPASEKKFLEFVASVVATSEYKRSLMFLKLIGYGHLISVPSYSKFSIHLYINCSQFLYTSKIGIFIGNEEDDKIMIPTIRAVECVKENFDHYSDRSLMQEILGKIEKYSQPDPKKINAGGVVEMELVLEIILDRFESLCQSVINGVNLCLKSLAYESLNQISQSDIQLILRFLNKPYKDITKDLFIDDFYSHCIKSQICQIEDVLKTFNFDSIDDLSEAFQQNLPHVQSSIERFKHQDPNSKTFSIETWTDRVNFLSSQSTQDPELSLIGLTLLISELNRLNSNLNN